MAPAFKRRLIILAIAKFTFTFNSLFTSQLSFDLAALAAKSKKAEF